MVFSNHHAVRKPCISATFVYFATRKMDCSIFLLILSSINELKIQSHFAVDLNDPCINPNDIVFRIDFQ